MDNIIKKLTMYNNELNTSMNHNATQIFLLKQILKNYINKNYIYICGIGKNSFIAQKCVSTWNSIGLNAYNLCIPNLFHGDFGVLKSGNVVIYLTKSGNTIEIINAINYINLLNLNIIQICISNTFNEILSSMVNHYIVLSPVCELYSQIPTVSSVIYMSFLDILGLELADEIFKDYGSVETEFLKNHPGGNIGKTNICKL
jgi:arabinose-5-phosphate isomerase